MWCHHIPHCNFHQSVLTADESAVKEGKPPLIHNHSSTQSLTWFSTAKKWITFQISRHMPDHVIVFQTFLNFSQLYANWLKWLQKIKLNKTMEKSCHENRHVDNNLELFYILLIALYIAESVFVSFIKNFFDSSVLPYWILHRRCSLVMWRIVWWGITAGFHFPATFWLTAAGRYFAPDFTNNNQLFSPSPVINPIAKNHGQTWFSGGVLVLILSWKVTMQSNMVSEKEFMYFTSPCCTF